MHTPQTGLIGCGAMGSAIAQGIAKGGRLATDALWLFDLRKESMAKLCKELGARSASGLEEVCRNSQLIFVAVKPQDISSVLDKLKDHLKPSQVLISVAAGISTRYLQKRLPEGSKVVRLMPNTPCLVGAGAIALSPGIAATPEDVALVKELLKPLGITVEIPESLMEAVTGLSGSGPAYIFLVLEALIDGGVEVGLSREMSTDLAVQTVIGAAKMVQITNRHPAELKNAVTSPAGTTSTALRVLEDAAIRGRFISAVAESTRRAVEMAGEVNDG
ncbi:MAG TPA: pyrroline-5-carboxylate reductase [Firmicutes bacterium]|nr:pyrroline-5-carboxylate reductase [Bacillota bacterium]